MIKFKLFYQFNNEGKLLRVYRLGDKILLSINDDTDPDNPAALDFEIPPREVAPLGRALVNAWEVIHPLRGDDTPDPQSEPMAKETVLTEVMLYAILKIDELAKELAAMPLYIKTDEWRERLQDLSKYLAEAIK